MRVVAGAGVAIAVAALVISSSVGAGFEREYEKALLDFNSHVIVMSGGEIPDERAAMESLRQFSGATESELGLARRWGWLDGLVGNGSWLDNVMPKTVMERAAQVREIKERQMISMSPFLYREAMLVGPQVIRGVIVKGIDPHRKDSVGNMRISLAGGEVSLESALGAKGGAIPVLLGSAMEASIGPLAKRLRLVIPSKEGQRFVELVPVGSFESGMHDYDAEFMLMDIGAARRIFGVAERAASGIELRLSDPRDAGLFAQAMEEKLGSSFSATTWGDLNYDLLAAVRLERLVSALIMSIMLVVAALNIIAVLVLTAIKRLPEIAVFKALGLKDRDLERVLIRGGMNVGFKGISVGLAIGLLVSILTKKLGLIPLDAEIYMIDSLPIDISWMICGIIAFFCLSVLWLASRFAAKRLAGMDPAEGLARAR